MSMYRPTFFFAVFATSLIVASPLRGVYADTGNASIPASLTTSAETSALEVDYKPIEAFTDAFGIKRGGRTQIAYGAIKPQGEEFLEAYVAYLGAIPVSVLNRDDQLAYWLNLRNILVLQAMSEDGNRPKMSRNRGTANEPGEMWTQKRVTVDGHPLSIDDIERRILIAHWADTPDVIFGLYQGTRGGAALPVDGFDGATVHAELAELGRDFVNSSLGVRVRRGKAQIPEIFDWYDEALFGGDSDALTAHLAGLADDRLAADLASAREIKTRKYNYRVEEHILRQQRIPQSVTRSRGVGAGSGS